MAEAVLTPNVTSLVSNVLEISATDLAAKSTAERTALYKQGIRALKVINNDTIVLLGLQDGGSTEWLGSNQSVNNLLDNSDFTNPVNQRGGTSGTVTAWTYFIDRWQATDAALTYSISSDGIHLTAGEAWMAQNVQSSEAKAGRIYTFAVGLSDGTFTLCTGALPAGETSWTEFAGENDDNCYVRMAKITGAVISCSFKPKKAVVATWTALYEGSYTADTLPPYTPKGYAEELAECQRYYLSIRPSAGFVNSAASGAYFQAASAIRMRAIPSVARYDLTTLRVNGATILPTEITSVAAASTSSVLPIAIVQSSSLSGKANQPIIFEGTIDFSADL